MNLEKDGGNRQKRTQTGLSMTNLGQFDRATDDGAESSTCGLGDGWQNLVSGAESSTCGLGLGDE